jgi:putative Mn2+ efflux pump MntP
VETIMDTHVKVVGVLNIAMGACGLVGALVLMLIFGGAAGIVGSTGDPDAAVAIPIIGITGMALVILALVWSLPSLVIGIGLFRLRPWARIAGIVLSIFHMIWIPVGTIIGIYSLWVLFSKDAERLFTPPATPAAPPVM